MVGRRLVLGNVRSADWWRLRYRVALRVTYDVVIRIQQPHLRERVVEHITVCWCLACRYGHPGGFDGFFLDYCADVERDADPEARNPGWELHRVWTNHAAVLGGELDMVCPRL